VGKTKARAKRRCTLKTLSALERAKEKLKKHERVRELYLEKLRHTRQEDPYSENARYKAPSLQWQATENELTLRVLELEQEARDALRFATENDDEEDEYR
jgi:hypothetical protein